MKMKIKKWDIIIIGLLLIISFLPYILIKELVKDGIEGTYAYITVEGKPYKEIPLTGQVDYKEIIIQTKLGKNVIAIEDETIRMVEADCHDHLCEAFGRQSKPGDIIVCLPNKIYIEVRGNQEDLNNEVDSRAY